MANSLDISSFGAARCGAAWVLILILAWVPVPVAAKNAGSVEDGLAMLAQQIVDKSVAADRKTIAVLPFPNADGTCSVLSTYLVDELILALFSVPNSPLTIIERSQLEAILGELTMDSAGTYLDSATREELRKISGVQLLTLGTITVIGDTIRVNARLVGTETGRTESAAGITLPRTSAVTQLLQQPLSPEIPCGSNMGKQASTTATTAGAGGTVAFAPAPAPAPGSQATFDAGGVTFRVTNIANAGEGQYNVVMSATNTQEQPMRIMLIGPNMTLIDQMGNVATAQSTTGISPCVYQNAWFPKDRWCAQKTNLFSILTPGVGRTFAAKFLTAGDGGGTKLTGTGALTGRALVLEEGGKQAHPVPINFQALQLPQ